MLEHYASLCEAWCGSITFDRPQLATKVFVWCLSGRLTVTEAHPVATKGFCGSVTVKARLTEINIWSLSCRNCLQYHRNEPRRHQIRRKGLIAFPRRDFSHLFPFLSRLEHPHDSMSDADPKTLVKGLQEDECPTGVSTKGPKSTKERMGRGKIELDAGSCQMSNETYCFVTFTEAASQFSYSRPPNIFNNSPCSSMSRLRAVAHTNFRDEPLSLCGGVPIARWI